MNSGIKIKVPISVAASSVIVTVLLYFSSGDGFRICGEQARECLALVNNISEPMFWSFLVLSLSFLIIIFVRQEVFKAWVKFAIPGFIAMLAIMLYTYNNGPALGGFMNWGTDEQFATVLLPTIFFLISIIIIVKKHLHQEVESSAR